MSGALGTHAAVALLAGGRSARMGRDKAGLILEGETLLQRQARVFGGFAERLLSANDEGVSLPGFRRIADIRPGLGPLGGIWSVLRACESGRVLFVPCDMPHFTMAEAHRLLEELGDADACVAVVGGRAQPLGAVYAKSALPAVERCMEQGDYRLRAALALMDCRSVQMDDYAGRRAFANINTPEEFRRIVSQIEQE